MVVDLAADKFLGLRGQLIELACRPDPAVLMARVQARKESTGSTISAQAILDHRDADRR